jgi:hypothetical protein
MRKVVDTNFLKSEQLQEYLGDPANFAVLPDFAMMETLKLRDATAISGQLKSLAERPKQVIALKPTRAVGGLRSRPRSRGLQKRLIDKGQTAGFKAFCDKVEEARSGNETVRKQLNEKCDGATADLDQIAKGKIPMRQISPNTPRTIPTQNSKF